MLIELKLHRTLLISGTSHLVGEALSEYCLLSPFHANASFMGLYNSLLAFCLEREREREREMGLKMTSEVIRV